MFPVALWWLEEREAHLVEAHSRLCSVQFSKDARSTMLRTLMEVLLKLVTKLQSCQGTPDPEPSTESDKDGSELFLGVSQTAANKEQVGKKKKKTVIHGSMNSASVLFSRDALCVQILISALGSIFSHPCLEQWYLALELATFPPHSLNPVQLKHLCAQLSDGVTALLEACAPSLCDLGHSELLSPYLGAIERAVALQVMEMDPQATKKQSQPLQALVSLHSFMDSSHVREVVSKLLLLPQDCLIRPGSDGAPSELTVYGQAALQILTESNANPSKGRDVFLSHAHLHGLGTLLLCCSSPALDTFLLRTLSNEPGSARLIHTDVLLHCLQHPRSDTLAISSLLLHNCSTHRLFFEVWCLEPANMEKLSEQSETFLPLIGNYLQVAAREDPARPKDGSVFLVFLNILSY